jgi:hypothetical protein
VQDGEMARITAASVVHPSRSRHLQDVPKGDGPSTKLFHMLQPGVLVSFDEIVEMMRPRPKGKLGQYLNYLRVFYMLDIRKIKVDGKYFYCRVGEWKGVDYIDHMRKQISAMDLRKRSI